MRHGQSVISPESDICPFCQKHTIDESFRKQLEGFFDENYIRDIERVSTLCGRYSELVTEASAFLDDILSRTESDLAGIVEPSLIGTTVQLMKEAISFNLEMMTAKSKQPGLIVEFKDIKAYAETLQRLIDATNESIRVNNEMVDNFSSEQSSYIQNYLKMSPTI